MCKEMISILSLIAKEFQVKRVWIRRRSSSLVKNIIENGRAVCIFLDLEHGCHKCGVTQLSAVLFRRGRFEESDVKYDWVYKETFNEYVKPSSNAKSFL